MFKSYSEDNLILKGVYKDKEIYLEKLMDKYIPYVKKIVCSIGGKFLSQQDAEEVISDVFYAIWQNRKQLRTNEDIKPYLAQVSRNKTKNKLRHLANTSKLTIECINEIKDENIFVKEFVTNIQVDQIQMVINEFPYPEKNILYGYYFYEFKLNDIAEKLDLPLSTVKTKLYRSREKLKQILIDGGLYEKHI